MLGAIAGFEIRRRLQLLSTWIYWGCFFVIAILWMALAGGAFPSASVSFGAGGKVAVNSPYVLHSFISALSYFGVIVTAAIFGHSAYQDFEHDSHALFFTKPISKRDYLGGRFAGAAVVALGIMTSIGLGFFLGAHLPKLDRALLGPNIAAGYLLPYATTVIPNLLFTGVIFFALAALSRRMMPVWVATVILVVGYIAAGRLLADLENKTLAALIDPFGSHAASLLTEYWTAAERNTRLVPLSGLFLANRLLWLTVAALIAAFAYRRFAFAHLPPARRSSTSEPASASASASAPRISIHQRFDTSAQLDQLAASLRMALRGTILSPSFLIILLFGVAFVGVASLQVGKIYGTTTYPVTYAVLEVVDGTFRLFSLILITFFAGELVWRERDARLDQVVDAMPVPSWVSFVAKLSALCAMTVVLMAVVALCGISIQLLRGYTHLELQLYIKDLFCAQLIDLWLLCVLALLVQAIVNNKYAGHFIMVLYYIVSIALPLLGLEHNLYNYSNSPDVTYSDMNGYGHFVRSMIWFRVYWAAFAVALALLTHLAWMRGVDNSDKVRLKLARARLTARLRRGLAAALLLFVATGAFIFYNTNVRNRFRTSHEQRRDAAAYERNYKKWQKAPQPHVTSVTMAVDIFPDERRAEVHGTLGVINKSTTPIETLYVTAPSPSKLLKLRVNGGGKLTISDERLGFYALTLPAPLLPSQSASVEYQVQVAAHGFTNGGGDAVRVYGNGTFFDTDSLLALGYREGAELSDDDARRKEGLQPKERARDLDDAEGKMRSALDGADWVTFDATVSTSADQLAVAPGTLVRQWSEGGRNHFHYQMQTRTLNFYAFLSARYAVLKEHWHDIGIEIDYHPGHEYDLQRMVDGIKQSLDYYIQHFGPFQFDHVRILEFPRYATFAESFANTIPYSEGIGFIAKVNPKDEDDVDYPFYVTAHEVGHQWWAHQVIGADVQGAAMLTESLAQYSALMVMKHRVGPAQMKRFLKYELDRYLTGRGMERKKELPLYRVETQPYIYYQKGSLILYALQDYIGEDVLNGALHRFLDKHKFEEGPYATSRDLLAEIRAAAPPQYQQAITDLFEKIILYENRALKATWRKDGEKYQVHLSVTAKKLQADEQGHEKEVPLDDWIDLGVLDAKGEPLALERKHVTAPAMEVTFVVDKQPARAGIDPLVKLIDRKWEDNTVKVERE